jgi:hypothetical protein
MEQFTFLYSWDNFHPKGDYPESLLRSVNDGKDSCKKRDFLQQ